MRILGLDPGLRLTGWGVIDVQGNHLSFVACGVVRTDAKLGLAQRLVQIHQGLVAVIGGHRPDEAAVEKTFVNRNPASALKLGQARGVVMLAAAEAGLAVAEYPPNVIKKSVVGAGHAAKQQVQMMVRMLLPGIGESQIGADAADALATAVCHAHHRQTQVRIKARIKEVVS